MQRCSRGIGGNFPWPQAQCTTSAPFTAPSTEVAVASFAFPAEQYPAIWEISKTCRVTPFLVLLSATALAASRVTGQTDLLLATDTACRDDPAVRDVIGFFVNTHLTRVNLSTDSSFDDVVAAVGENWFAADEHRNCHIHPILEVAGEPKSMRVDMARSMTTGSRRSPVPRCGPCP